MMIRYIMSINCLRCHHTWNSKVKEPKKCPKCNSPYWNKPKMVPGAILPDGTLVASDGKTIIKNSTSDYETQRLIAQIDSLHEEVAEKDKTIAQLRAEPPKLFTGEVLPIINLPRELFPQMKNRIILAMRDKLPIRFALKGQDITEIL